MQQNRYYVVDWVWYKNNAKSFIKHHDQNYKILLNFQMWNNQYVNHVEIFSYGILTYFFKYSPGMIFILCNVVKGPCCKEFIFSFSRRYIFKNTKISFEWPRSRQSQQPKLMLQYGNGHHLNLYPQTNA